MKVDPTSSPLSVSDVHSPAVRESARITRVGAASRRFDREARVCGDACCLICDATNCELAFPRRLSWLWRCRDCGLRFAWPQPTDCELAEVYGDDYFATFGFDAAGAEAYRSMKRVQAADLLEFAPAPVDGATLLDVGAGLGDLVWVARQHGWDAMGIEMNPFAVATANNLMPECVIESTWEAFEPATRERFDVVTCTDVIEHVRDPEAALGKLLACLRPGGCLLLTTPDVSCRRARWMGAAWYHYHRDHLWYFQRSTLVSVARRTGFEVEMCRPASKQFQLAYVLSVLSSYPNQGSVRWISRAIGRCLPADWKGRLNLRVTEGLLLVARRPMGDYHP